ncbi:hypothetical protein SAMN03097699_2644 [Flavobacteriaceae bacterium MAR_2010_188]|nr:hypothetical protein SAMN03097699_2644 [Flavobacteriaceae bacterium MAR_2010_188]
MLSCKLLLSLHALIKLQNLHMNNFKIIQKKLEEFIRRYYTNELLKGAILFFAIGLLYLILTLGIEYFLWLGPTPRTILFWTFIAVETGLFIKFIVIPITKLFKLQKGIDYHAASIIIGKHFPEVSDKLVNVLQLKQNSVESELLIASIEQKSVELQPVPFKMAVDFRQNVKYLKYAAIPIAIILVFLAIGKISWFSESYDRVVNYDKAYEPPAPFQFFVRNDNLNAVENKDFTLIVSTAGDITPENVQIEYKNQTYYLQQLSPGQFEYVFSQPKEDIDFKLSANNVRSKEYSLEVVKIPTLVNFEMSLDYPSYTNKADEVLKSTGNAAIPEGTTVKWKVNTKSTTDVSLYSLDTLQFKKLNDVDFEASKQLFNDFNYSINSSNESLKDYESLGFSIDVVKDNYPELILRAETDSIDNQTLYFYGQVSDDYGLKKLQLVYYPSDDEKDVSITTLPVSASNFDEFISAFPTNQELKDGTTYQLYFQIFDNDAIHSYKSTKSQVFTYRKLTEDEEENQQLQQQNETIQEMNKSFDNLKEQDKKLEEFSKTQKEKDQLNFNDKKKFDDFLKRQKEQEQLMQNFNKELKDNLEEFKLDEEDPFKEELKDRLQENEEQLIKDEKLLKELEELQDKMAKEEFTQKLEDLAKQNKNKQRSLEQILELTKRFFVAKKMEKLSQELEQLGEKQVEQSKKNKNENTSEEQEKLNKEFEKFMEDMKELEKENEKLKKPMELPADELDKEDIKQDQKEATEKLENSESDKNEDSPQSQENKEDAKKKQQSAGQKMKKLSSKMKQSMSAGGQEQMAEDAAMLRQILDNLVVYSFDQEELMNQFRKIEVNNNNYGKYLRKQSNLREHFEHIDDSLFALSLRQPKISEMINGEITNVFFNIDKSVELLSENQLYQGVASQQYTVTSANNLASYLSDVMDNMEQQMNPSSGSGSGKGQGMGQGGGGDMQLPDIIMSQEELNKKMEEGLKEGEEGEKSGESNGGKEGEGKEGENGDKNGEGKDGKDGKDGDKIGEGEGDSEKMNGELYEIFQKQQMLRQALENKLGKEGQSQDMQKLLKDMEQVELDLLNKGFTNQTLQKMMDLQHQLLKMDNATFMQGEENKRQSKTNKELFNNSSTNKIPTAKEYFNTTEILNRQALPLQQIYRKKVQDYFKKTDDQL